MGKCNISITLDGDLGQHASSFPTFTPGQTISGKVSCSFLAQKTVDVVLIILEGKCHTDVVRKSGNGNRVHHRETIQMFRLETILFKGEYKVQPSTLEWPFSFVIPKYSSFDRGRRGDGDANFESGPQPLPPSLDVHSGGHRPIKAQVTYNLRAQLNPGIFSLKESVLPINIIPLSNSPLPPPDSTPIRMNRQEWRSGLLRPAKHTFKQKMNHVFSSDPSLKRPSITFQPTTYMPRAASIWQPLPLAFSIQHHITGQTDPESPPLLLDSVKLQLKQYTAVRVKALISGYTDNGKSALVVFPIRLSAVPLPLDNLPVQITDQLRLADMLPEVHRLAPTFKTYIINQSYSLKMTALIRHADTGHIFKAEAKTPFQILPTEGPSIGEQLTPSFSPADQAPAYEPHGAAVLPPYDAGEGSSRVPYQEAQQQGRKHYPEAMDGEKM